MTHQWQPIKDLDDSFNEDIHEELRYLADIWREQKDDFDSEQMGEFSEKIKREWSIETGLVGEIYHFERGITKTLIERGIDENRISHSKENAPKRIITILNDHEHAFDFVKGMSKLSVSHIKELHKLLLRSQDTTKGVDEHGKISDIPLLQGEFKACSNNPHTNSGEVHEYCPPEHVESEMDNLIAMHEAHAKEKYPLTTAAWLHHRFTQIHPFQDGNGRIARCLATLIFIKAGWFPLVIRNNDERERYIDSLEAADTGDLSPLINLFAAVQRRYFLKALSITQKIIQEPSDSKIMEGMATQAVAQESTTTAIIKSAADKIKERARKIKEHREKSTPGYESTEKIAENLVDLAHQRMQKICTEIDQEFEGAFRTRSRQIKNETSLSYNYVNHKHIAAAKHYGYRPDITAYRSWVNISIDTDTTVNIIRKRFSKIYILFHGIGHQYRGVIACSASYSAPGIDKFLSDETFQINYKEPPEQAQERFKKWLDKIVPAGLRLWYDHL